VRFPTQAFGTDELGSLPRRWVASPEPAITVQAGRAITLETLDGFDGQLTPASVHADVLALDLGRSHPLSGPVWVDGAEPGDLLVVEFLGFETSPFGITAQIPGVGLLADSFPDPYLVTWSIEDGCARSAALPGVAVPARTFAGVVGVAPTAAQLTGWLCRESSTPTGELPAGASTVPPRELGGNMDIPRLVAGSRLYLPVACRGALFSLGDVHFAQGDGEVCGTAIEVAGAVTVRFEVARTAWRPRAPAYSVPARHAGPVFATTGISLNADGDADVRDIYGAAQNAVGEMIDYLCLRHGFGRQAAYALISATVDIHVSELVNAPHCLVSALLPLDVFEQQTDSVPEHWRSITASPGA
jgi:formamidase